LREVELKAVVDDWNARRRRLEKAGAVLTFAGRLEDRRYDTPDRSLAKHDQVLRVRVYRAAGAGTTRCSLDWKGRTRYRDGYKVREELSASAHEPDALAAILERLGYEVIHAVDREIAQYDAAGAVVRFERYPRMDDLVEVEGTPEAIERAVAALGIAREAFTSERLRDFVRRFQARTGKRAALADADLKGKASYRLEDA
jgi:predicted adenylyl cyclase CyaB